MELNEKDLEETWDEPDQIGTLSPWIGLGVGLFAVLVIYGIPWLWHGNGPKADRAWSYATDWLGCHGQRDPQNARRMLIECYD